MFLDLDGPVMCDAAVKKATGARHPPLPIQDFIAFAESAGIGRKPAVCFDDWGSALAARMWWQLTSIGCEAYLVDGGINAYFAHKDGEGALLPTESGADGLERKTVAEPYAPGTSYYFLANKGKMQWPRTVPLEFIDELNSEDAAVRATHAGLVLTDARAPDRYGSTARPTSSAPDPLAFHIPGAVNLPFPQNLTKPQMDPETKLKPVEELQAKFRKLFDDNKIKNPNEQLVMSCGSGVTAAFNVAVMAHVGAFEHDVENGKELPRIYLGSWSEYSTLRRDRVMNELIAQQGFGLFFEKKNMALEGFASAMDLPVVVDGVSFSSGKEAAESDLGKSDEGFAKAMKNIRANEIVKVVTASKQYRVEQK
jgi:thiosulfate/3-mercaptopyruvate sulfurtransferase